MNKKILLIIAGAVLVLCLVCVGVIVLSVGLGVGLTQPIANVGDEFMTALKNEDYTRAYNLCAPSLQQELRNPQNLANLIRNARVQPTQWSYTSRNVSNDQGQLGRQCDLRGKLRGNVATCPNSDRWHLEDRRL
jgi:hypothetical protein